MQGLNTLKTIPVQTLPTYQLTQVFSDSTSPPEQVLTEIGHVSPEVVLL